MVEDKKFIDMCAVCKQGVTKIDMVYQKGRVFHPRCYETQGSTFPSIDQDLAQLSARTRIELVQMKNLKVRSDSGQMSKPQAPKKKKKAKKKPAKKAKKSSKPKKRASKKRK